MAGYRRQISFRLSDEHVIELERRAKLTKKSLHEYAREIVISVLTMNPAEETRNRVAELQDQVHRLREDLHTAVIGILVEAGDKPLSDAAEWVVKNLQEDEEAARKADQE